MTEGATCIEEGPTGAQINAALVAGFGDATARQVKADEVRADLRRLVVEAHGATVPAIPAQVDGWVAAAIERRDQDATDRLVHRIFENSPQRDDDPAVCQPVAMISKNARG